MFKRLVIDFTILAVSFFGLWFLLSEIDFIKEEREFKISVRQEEKIGRVFKELFTADAEVIDDDLVTSEIKKLTEILKDNLDSSEYNYRIVVTKTPEINAFALPGGYIVIFSGLIDFCETPEELAGVIAHEMGHNENHDILKRMAKNIGISVTLNTLFGGENKKINQLLNQVISTKFDRDQEERADIFAANLMIKSGINPGHLANFFERLLEQKPEILNELDFLMTHPADDKRIEAIKQFSSGKTINEQHIDLKWEELSLRIQE